MESDNERNRQIMFSNGLRMYSSVLLLGFVIYLSALCEGHKKPTCIDAYVCVHTKKRTCGLNPETREVRWFIDNCDILEFNCEYKTVFLVICIASVAAHGPPRERDNEDIAMGRKMGPKWCSMAKVCNHDRVPICGISHAGDIMGFRDLCDMFDFNCIRRRS
ncbi:Uncharacterized protein OBRU01_24520 [Operophtera brumata]|uniref:Uncharacterized protein n=1 Tax=Operophtera brumata TaxID=104452 RepID=A0A0L7KLJ6_OPEBR|nr:Uncharacterized protein OBRU01_24520 [Operophtera brumata]